MFSIPQTEQGEAVVSMLGIAAVVLKWVSDRAKKDVEKEDDPIPAKEEDVEVITRKDLNDILKKVEETNESFVKAKNSFEDTLACINIINILLQVISTDKRRQLLRSAEQQIYTFLRSADFPSRQMIVTMVEMSIKDIEETSKEWERKDKRLNLNAPTDVDGGSDKLGT